MTFQVCTKHRLYSSPRVKAWFTKYLLTASLSDSYSLHGQMRRTISREGSKKKKGRMSLRTITYLHTFIMVPFDVGIPIHLLSGEMGRGRDKEYESCVDHSLLGCITLSSTTLLKYDSNCLFFDDLRKAARLFSKRSNDLGFES